MAVLGIDPGKTGGLALLFSDGIVIEPMPEPKRLRQWLFHWRRDISGVGIEEPGMRPRQRTQDAMKVGRGFGLIEGMLLVYEFPYTIIPPRIWSLDFPHGVTEKDKGKRYAAIKVARRQIVAELFPRVDFRETERCSTAHSGMVDAALIAVHTSRHTKVPNGN